MVPGTSSVTSSAVKLFGFILPPKTPARFPYVCLEEYRIGWLTVELRRRAGSALAPSLTSRFLKRNRRCYPASIGAVASGDGLARAPMASWQFTLLSTRQIARLTHSLVSLVLALFISLPLTYVAFHRPSSS